jgi:hypothetical protein
MIDGGVVLREDMSIDELARSLRRAALRAGVGMDTTS